MSVMRHQPCLLCVKREKSWSGPRLAALCSVVAGGGITDLRVDANVSPANSFDLCAAEWTASIPAFSGKAWKAGCRHYPCTLPRRTAGREVLIVSTGYAGIPWLISAPTMHRPSVLHDGDPVRRSARAAMRRGLNNHLRP